MSTPVCPHSGTTLGIRDAEGHVGHCCDDCRGIWLPRRFIETIGLERNFSAKRFAGLLAEQAGATTDLACPEGCGKLRQARVKGIELDWCPGCGGVWFDRGEVARLLAQYPPRQAAKDDGLDAGDAIDIADLVGSLFDLFS